MINTDEKINYISSKTNFIGVLDLLWDKKKEILHLNERLHCLSYLSIKTINEVLNKEKDIIIQKLTSTVLKLVNIKYENEVIIDQRNKYLSSILSIICETLNIKYVSIFEANESFENLYCIGTTGFSNIDDYNKLVYRKSENLTWNIFETNTPKVIRDIKQDYKIKNEINEKYIVNKESDAVPLIAIPIPGNNSEHASGVIRALGKVCYINSKKIQNFSSIDQIKLTFIASQISPILQMIRYQSHRERFLERTSHQVIQPLQGIVAYSCNLVDGIYGKMYSDKVEEKLKYIRAMSKHSACMLRTSVWASGITNFSFLINNESQSRKYFKQWILERIIDIQPIRKHENIEVKLVNENEVEKMGDFKVYELYFDQVIQNVLHNAVKYSYPNSTLTNKIKITKTTNRSGVPVLVFKPSF